MFRLYFYQQSRDEIQTIMMSIILITVDYAKS